MGREFYRKRPDSAEPNKSPAEAGPGPAETR
jgi:hypothetical protein